MIGGAAPYLAAGALTLAVAAGLGGYAHGVDVGRARAEEAQRKLVDRAHAERDRLRTQVEAGALLHLEADRERRAANREIVRESTRIVERPVYRSLCVDPDGVRLLDRAADVANGRDGADPLDESAAGFARLPPERDGDGRGAVPGQPD